MMVIDVTEQNFEDEVLKSDLPSVVDFWAPWCGPCKIMGPLIEKFADEYQGKVKFCKVNVDENQQLAANAGVQSIPLLVFYKDGNKVNESVGVVPDPVVRPMIDALL